MRQRRRLEFGPPLTATGTATTRRAEAAATLYDVHVANTISSDRKRAPMGTPPRSTPERAAGRGGKRRARMPGESGSRHMLSGQRAPPQWTARSRDARAWLGWTGSRWTDARVVEEDSALIKRKGSLDDARAVRTDGQARLEMDDHRALAFLTLLTGLGGQATSPVAGVEPRRTG
ncbi:hypothetical protein PANT_9c00081 [Moesziomyces antarcticus T-34]|uniref:Uncharacterized protein n=1 Tax=Pseudozyma antarctica (strain T-34) TaxID=1151754 RepID=M9LNG7_PSEA3|nr:hypothetical protein PANT_9c00081 [Moesziomyces antarcticus T-34]